MHDSPMLAQTVSMASVASGTMQQYSPVGITTSVLTLFKLTVPVFPLFLKNDVALLAPAPSTGTCVLSGKYHCPALDVAQHGILSVMHWSPVLDVLLVTPISVMGMILLLAA